MALEQTAAKESHPQNQSMEGTLPSAYWEQLHAILPQPGQRLTRWPERLVYERDANGMHTQTPFLVLLPETVEQVQALVKLHGQFHLPLTARGAGTGQSGGSVATPNGVIISMARLNKVIELNPEQRWACVEPGLSNLALNQQVAAYGLQFAPDPSSRSVASLGGNVAENAGGLHSLLYGVTRDHVLGLEGVTASGEVLRFGGAAAMAAPLALSDLWCGSEGTLALITRLWLRLSPLPTHRKVFLLSYNSTQTALSCVQQLIASGLVPLALECIDRTTIACVNQAFNAGLPTNATMVLLLELEGTSPQHIATQEHLVQQVLHHYPPIKQQTAESPEAIEALWLARRGAAASYGLLAPSFYVLDCVVPRAKLAQALEGILLLGEQFNIPVANVFHAADGNLHPHLLFHPNKLEEKERVPAAAELIVKLCLSLGGTLSGEHGIGLEKQHWMPWQFTPADLSVMQRLSQVWDPNGLLNPDKLLPTQTCCGGTPSQHIVQHGAAATLKGYNAQALSAQDLWI